MNPRMNDSSSVSNKSSVVSDSSSSNSKKLTKLKCPYENCEGRAETEISSECRNIQCDLCKKMYCIYFCIYCFKPIYYSKELICECQIMTCPYSNCGLKFIQMHCPKCTQKIFADYSAEGEILPCPNCKEKIRLVKCPLFGCPNVISLPLNYIEGEPIVCKNHLEIPGKEYKFQCITCVHCSKSIIFKLQENVVYIEGQKVTCPYKECQRSFNKVTCPQCKGYITMAGGDLFPGKYIDCLNPRCKFSFIIYYCCFCSNVIKRPKDKTFEPDGQLLPCPNPKCKKNILFINCLLCHNTFYWKNINNYIPGQLIKCHTPTCSQRFIRVKCPFCQNAFVKLLQNFSFGKNILCPKLNCEKEFRLIYCEKCKFICTKKVQNSPHFDSICDKCGNDIASIKCPYCYELLTKVDQKYENCKIKCPTCTKIFYYHVCPFCNGDFIDKIYLNVSLRCPNFSCKKLYSYTRCTKCNKTLSQPYNGMDLEEVSVKCTSCNLVYQIKKENESYEPFMNCQKIKFDNGKVIKFFKGEEEPYSKAITDELLKVKEYKDFSYYESLKDSLKLEDNSTKNNPEVCIICTIEKKEAVFYPCGHCCTCKECGDKIKDSQKGCPICKVPIEYVLAKVIDD